MKPDTQHKIKFWTVTLLGTAGVIGVCLLSAKSNAEHSKPLTTTVDGNTNSPLTETATKVFRGSSCAGCHYLTGIWGRDGVTLDNMADKYDPATLRLYIRTPKLVDAHALMPVQKAIGDTEVEKIVNNLLTLPHTETNLNHEHH